MVVAAEADYANHGVPPCENLDYHPNLKPEEVEAGTGVCNSSMVMESTLCEVPM